MRIIQLSDSHLSLGKPARTAELEACINHINALDRQPDAVVHTGDIAHDGLVEEYEAARSILEQLKAPYFVLPGNRDHRGHLVSVFDDGDYVRNDMDFVQYAVEEFSARLIMADSKSGASNKGQFCNQRLEHLHHLLTLDTSRPAIMFLHHPPFQVDVGPEQHNFQDWTEAEALLAELKRHDHLHGIFCGHVHRAFETSVGAVRASVVSSVVSDLRWDKPEAAERGLPVFNAYSVLSST